MLNKLKGDSMPEKVEIEVTPRVNQLEMAVRYLHEKVAREYGLTVEEVKQSTITIKGGDIVVKSQDSTKKGK